MIKYLLIVYIFHEEIIVNLMKNMGLLEILGNGVKELDSDIIVDSLESLLLLISPNNYKTLIIQHLDQNSTVSIIEKLQVHRNSRICEKSVKLIEIILEN